jgi:hypothetical protein
MTSEIVSEYDVILWAGDTTFLDYDGIVAKKEGRRILDFGFWILDWGLGIDYLGVRG